MRGRRFLNSAASVTQILENLAEISCRRKLEARLQEISSTGNSRFFRIVQHYCKYSGNKLSFCLPHGVLGSFGFADLLCTTLLEKIDYVPRNILDAGCGCGAMGITLTAAGHSVSAVDVNRIACLATRINATMNGVQGRIEIVHSEIASFSPADKFDVIAVNPPLHESHLSAVECARLRQELNSGHPSPAACQFANNNWRDRDGFTMLEKIFIRSEELLVDDGLICIGFGNSDEDWHDTVCRMGLRYNLKPRDTIWRSLSYVDVGFENQVTIRQAYEKARSIGIDVFFESPGNRIWKSEGQLSDYFFPAFCVMLQRSSRISS